MNPVLLQCYCTPGRRLAGDVFASSCLRSLAPKHCPSAHEQAYRAEPPPAGLVFLNRAVCQPSWLDGMSPVHLSRRDYVEVCQEQSVLTKTSVANDSSCLQSGWRSAAVSRRRANLAVRPSYTRMGQISNAHITGNAAVLLRVTNRRLQNFIDGVIYSIRDANRSHFCAATTAFH